MAYSHIKKKLSLLTGSFLLSAAVFANSPNAIDQEMDAAVQKAENEVQAQFKNATRRDTVPLWSDKVQLENAIIQLEVKKTLVNNFRGTVSLQSPLVRSKLLELLNKDIIMESDLAELQNLVNQERVKLNAQPREPVQVPAPVSAPATPGSAES
ncbi:MAG TPA: hypothetical protein PLC42_01550 [Parachlamydiaceae bacterium]|nr:hypothetical protein [Parachlamydiaceae bacterium]